MKLYVDVKDYIHDEKILNQIKIMEDKRKSKVEFDGNGSNLIEKPSIRAIIQYTEGGYFGDSDLLC